MVQWNCQPLNIREVPVPFLISTSLLAWLLAPLRAPDAMQVLEAANSLSRARKLDLESFLRTHLVCQLQQ